MHITNLLEQDLGPNGGNNGKSQQESRSFNRDTGYICVVCSAVFSFQRITERPCAFCAVCGTKLLDAANVQYSNLADMSQEKIESYHKKLFRRLRTIRQTILPPIASLSKGIVCSIENEEAIISPAGHKRPAPANLSIQHSKARKEALVPVNGMPEKNGKRKLWPSRNAGSIVHSKFCDVCGHSQTDVDCFKCPATFHKRCLCLKSTMPVPPRFTCHGCLNEERRQKRVAPALLQDAFQERSVVVHKLPETPMQCSSCGYHELESLKCEDCKRWFCFACMCVSLDTLPNDTWNCPECVGLVAYDQMLEIRIATSREKMNGESVSAQVEDGFSQLVFDLFCGCAWDEWSRNIHTLVRHAKKQLDNGIIPVVMPFHSLHYARTGVDMDKGVMRRISEAYSKDTKDKALKSVRSRPAEDGTESPSFRAWKQETLTECPRRLRIGYISSDFVNHPTADLIQSALLSHDESRFEIFCYSITKDDKSDYRRTLSQRMEHFRTFSRRDTDRRCAEIIADDGIHILINLNGHTANDRNGISALRPAPVQLVYLAYPGTMGADYIDFNVVDPIVCPPEHREHYTERLLQMPFCYQTNSFRMLYPEVHDVRCLPSRQEHQLPDDAFVFCNFCRLGRITPELFQVWIRILRRVPNSVIWLYKHPKTAVLRLQEQARRASMDVRRFIFGPPCSPKIEHLKRVTLADLCLDTLIYNGHTTGSDMLWAGVPMVTMRGDNWPSLVATCLAHAVEMPEMVVQDLRGYEELAVDLATNPDKMLAWRTKLAEKRQTAPLFDHVRWVRSFEGGLETVWDMQRRNQTEPRDIVVRDVGPGPAREQAASESPLPRAASRRVRRVDCSPPLPSSITAEAEAASHAVEPEQPVQPEQPEQPTETAEHTEGAGTEDCRSNGDDANGSEAAAERPVGTARGEIRGEVRLAVRRMPAPMPAPSDENSHSPKDTVAAAEGGNVRMERSKVRLAGRWSRSHVSLCETVLSEGQVDTSTASVPKPARGRGKQRLQRQPKRKVQLAKEAAAAAVATDMLAESGAGETGSERAVSVPVPTVAAGRRASNADDFKLSVWNAAGVNGAGAERSKQSSRTWAQKSGSTVGRQHGKVDGEASATAAAGERDWREVGRAAVGELWWAQAANENVAGGSRGENGQEQQGTRQRPFFDTGSGGGPSLTGVQDGAAEQQAHLAPTRSGAAAGEDGNNEPDMGGDSLPGGTCQAGVSWEETGNNEPDMGGDRRRLASIGVWSTAPSSAAMRDEAKAATTAAATGPRGASAALVEGYQHAAGSASAVASRPHSGFLAESGQAGGQRCRSQGGEGEQRNSYPAGSAQRPSSQSHAQYLAGPSRLQQPGGTAAASPHYSQVFLRAGNGYPRQHMPQPGKPPPLPMPQPSAPLHPPQLQAHAAVRLPASPAHSRVPAPPFPYQHAAYHPASVGSSGRAAARARSQAAAPARAPRRTDSYVADRRRPAGDGGYPGDLHAPPGAMLPRRSRPSQDLAADPPDAAASSDSDGRRAAAAAATSVGSGVGEGGAAWGGSASIATDAQRYAGSAAQVLAAGRAPTGGAGDGSYSRQASAPPQPQPQPAGAPRWELGPAGVLPPLPVLPAVTATGAARFNLMPIFSAAHAVGWDPGGRAAASDGRRAGPDAGAMHGGGVYGSPGGDMAGAGAAVDAAVGQPGPAGPPVRRAGAAGGAGPGDDVCTVELLKDSVTRMVKHRCNAQYEAHRQRQSASEAVRMHLKSVFRGALVRAREWAHRKVPAGISVNDQVHFERRFMPRVEEIVAESSRELQPTFHWLHCSIRGRDPAAAPGHARLPPPLPRVPPPPAVPAAPAPAAPGGA